MSPNIAMDFPSVDLGMYSEDVGRVIEQIMRSIYGSPGRGIPYSLTEYDGFDPSLAVRNLDPTQSFFADFGNYDDSVNYQGDNDGHAFEGPWNFTGDGEIHGNTGFFGDVGIVGNLGLQGDFIEIGNASIDGTLGATGPVTFGATLDLAGDLRIATDKFVVTAADGSLNIGPNHFTVAGATGVTAWNVNKAAIAADGSLNIGPAKFTVAGPTGNLVVEGSALLNGLVTLGNAAADVITVTGTMTVAEILTLAKGLIVDTTTLVVDAVNDRVGIKIANPAVPLDVRGAAQFWSTAAGTPLSIGFGRTATDGTIGVAGGAGHFMANATAGDTIFRSETQALLLGSGGGNSVIKLEAGKMGFFGVTTVVQQAAPAVVSGTADATYSANEVSLINDTAAAVNTLRTRLLAYGLLV